MADRQFNCLRPLFSIPFRIRLERDAETARFNMDSTVILLLPPARAAQFKFSAGDKVRVGDALA